MKIGHVGIWADRIPTLREFYVETLGLTVTDETPRICFLSSQPENEHHELVLIERAQNQATGPGANQVSWRVETMEEVLAIHQRLQGVHADIQGTYSHGYAISVYFYDPEGNRGEVYWTTGWAVHQPYREELSFDQRPLEIVAQAKRLLDDVAVMP